ncbi:glycoside hydrolase family 16 protein [Pararcticibacter amylolyticus]|uniref:Beta-glucanase n=1 Tax=Pararcticibacter amylolyticus TaxID=2173175 RepID=A0A2U2PKJ4_9SPHI|nr:glycoside hydrolase family 16 protein [Pararcticibacter amylolyticus]PWG81848.1 beta-glucanase [Pararcticibacter amylolyticus]
MTKSLIFLPAFCLVICSFKALCQNTANINNQSTDGYKLVWSDEFNAKGTPDPRNWKFEKGFVRNNELQWYQESNAFCDSGLLIIEGRRETFPNKEFMEGSSDWRASRRNVEYTSASINTRGLHSWKYGRFVMRGRIDISEGMWPAFWTLGITRQWPSNGEIDIMEYYKGNILANIACGTTLKHKAKWYSKMKAVKDFKDPSWAAKFHIWRMDWDDNGISLYVDDELLNKVALDDLVNTDGSGFNPFKQDHYVLLNLAIGGDNGGDPSGTTFPRRFEIDYVRVYQK